MKSTSFFSRLVRSAARSLGFSSTGPDVWRRFTPSSWAMMCDSVVLPSPGGPNSNTWSSASPRLRAAPMKISSCSRILAWPTYWSSSLGRSARSIASSCGEAGSVDTTRCGGGSSKSSVWIVTSPHPSFGQRLQGLADALAHADITGQSLQRRSRFLVAVAQGHQGLQDVALGIAGGAGARGAQVGAELALEFQQQSFGRLLADARHLDQPARVLGRHRLGDVRHAHA